MILNYAVTSNHIHLIVVGGEDRDVIPDSIKLIAGRTGQEFNQRKNRPDKPGSSIKELFGKIDIMPQQSKAENIFLSALYTLTSIW